jgi:thiol-disulfide isomerase/thioredoxin
VRIFVLDKFPSKIIMRTFDSHLDFENYWFGKSEPVKPAGIRASDSAFLVYFSASWCGPCKRLNMDLIEAAAKVHGVPLWKVEQTVNDYTAGFCDVRSLPSFILFTPKKIVSKVSSSATEDVVNWINANCVVETK